MTMNPNIKFSSLQIYNEEEDSEFYNGDDSTKISQSRRDNNPDVKDTKISQAFSNNTQSNNHTTNHKNFNPTMNKNSNNINNNNNNMKNLINNKAKINNNNNNKNNININNNGNINNINNINSNLNPYIFTQNNIPMSLNVPINNPLIMNPMNQINNVSNYMNPNQTNYENESINFDNYEEDEENEDEIKEDRFIEECIKNRKFNELSDKDLLSNIYIIAKEQAGCRYLQQKIDDNPNFANYELYPEIDEILIDLVCDPFGNYLIQKMLESLTTDKLNLFIKSVKNIFLRYHLNLIIQTN